MVTIYTLFKQKHPGDCQQNKLIKSMLARFRILVIKLTRELSRRSMLSLIDQTVFILSES